MSVLNSFQLDSNNYLNLSYSTEKQIMNEEEQNKQTNQQISQLQTQCSINSDSNQLQLNSLNTSNKSISKFCIKPIFCPNNKQLNLFTGLSITDDGVIRYHSSINQVCFGLQQEQVVQVEDLKKLGVVNIQLCRDNGYVEHTVDQALNFIYNVPHMPYELAQKSIIHLRHVMNNFEYDYQEEQKNQELQKFVGIFFQFLEKYNELYPNQMYHYCIGRFNIKLQDMEYVNNGYSKSYLDFLGMNPSTLSQIILRNQKIDLIKNKLDITYQALKGIQNLYEKHGEDETYESYITTFDGFSIKIIQKRRDYSNIFGLQKFFGDEYEYEFVITEIDVELNDLQQLINYRQRIASIQNNINYDDFLSRELSNLFEDVEYSIQSHEFIEKFYHDNIENLKQMELLKKRSSRLCLFKSIKQ